MKNALFTYIIYIIIAGLLISCEESELDAELKKQNRTVADVEFSNLFVETYGNISSETSWILAENKSISVDLSALSNGSYTIQISTTDPRYLRPDCFLLAEYKNVSGSQTITFDIPLGLNNVYVSAIDNSGNGYLTRISTNEQSISINSKAIEYKVSEKEIPGMTYIIGFETYKDGTDFDYNDIVLGVQYVSGNSTAKVALLAVGCRIPVKVCYQRISNSEKSKLETLWEEAHDAVGYPPYYDMTKDAYVYDAFNTGWNTISNTPIASIDMTSFETSILDLAPNLRTVFNPDDKAPHTSYAPSDKGSKYPEAICIANQNWAWPSEESEIGVVYADFKNYVNNPKAYPHWSDGLWAKANILENNSIEDNNAYGRILKLENGIIKSEELKDFANYSCKLIFKVSDLNEPTTLKLCKYPDISLLYIEYIDIDKEGYYALDISSKSLKAIVDEQTLGQASGLQFDYEGFNIDEVYIR